MADNRRATLDYLLGKGLTRAQAAGVVGALMQESGLNVNAVNPSSGATGIAQWLGGRKTNLFNQKGAKTLQGQLDFLWSELQGPENAALKRLRGAHTVNDAADAFTWGFERPGRAEANMANRYKQGRSALELLGSGGGVQATGEEQSVATTDQTAQPSAMAALQTLRLPERPKLQVTAPTAPVFGAKPTVAPVLTPNAQPAPQPERLNVGKALEAILALQQPSADVTPTSGAGSESPSRDSSPAPGGNGKFTISGPQPERLQKSLVNFAGKVADVFGGTLGGLDGSSHSKYTVNGNVSQHYTGNATDIFTINGKPATGKRLIAAGRAALEAAGMDPRKARKAPGGLYNVNGHQIIFGVNGKQYGGNHLDHLHISAR